MHNRINTTESRRQTDFHVHMWLFMLVVVRGKSRFLFSFIYSCVYERAQSYYTSNRNCNHTVCMSVNICSMCCMTVMLLPFSRLLAQFFLNPLFEIFLLFFSSSSPDILILQTLYYTGKIKHTVCQYPVAKLIHTTHNTLSTTIIWSLMWNKRVVSWPSISFVYKRFKSVN